MKTQSMIVLLSLVFSKIVFGADSCGPEAFRLIGRWPADGTTSDVVSTNHALLDNGATFSTGILGQSFSLDGASDQVQIPPSEQLRIIDSFTIEFWFRPTVAITPADPDVHFLFNNGFGSIGTANSDGRIEVVGPFPRPTSVTSNWQAGVWYHVAVTYVPERYSLFINGVQESSIKSGYSILNSEARIFLGSSTTPTSGQFSGCIDELAIYNRALSASEIRGIYEGGTFSGTQPPLAIGPTDECVVLSWPGSITNYVPQMAASLSSPGAWTDMTNAVFTTGVRNWFIDSGAAVERFYRLRGQE